MKLRDEQIKLLKKYNIQYENIDFDELLFNIDDEMLTYYNNEKMPEDYYILQKLYDDILYSNKNNPSLLNFLSNNLGSLQNLVIFIFLLI